MSKVFQARSSGQYLSSVHLPRCPAGFAVTTVNRRLGKHEDVTVLRRGQGDCDYFKHQLLRLMRCQLKENTEKETSEAICPYLIMGQPFFERLMQPPMENIEELL